MSAINFEVEPKRDVTFCSKNGEREIYRKVVCMGLVTSPVLLAFNADIDRKNVTHVIIEGKEYSIIDTDGSDEPHVFELRKL